MQEVDEQVGPRGLAALVNNAGEHLHEQSPQRMGALDAWRGVVGFGVSTAVTPIDREAGTYAAGVHTAP
jgi:hypothetical protein